MRRRWQSSFGATLPLGWRLRHELPSRWLRIHSLPESKRYAETATERDVLLKRHFAVARAVLGACLQGGPRCIVFVLRYPEPGETCAPPTLPGLEYLEFESWRVPAPWDQEIECCIFAATLIWNEERLGRTLLAVAGEEERALFLSVETEQIYAPYDGGADLFMRDSIATANLKQRFRFWLSSRDDGL